MHKTIPYTNQKPCDSITKLTSNISPMAALLSWAMLVIMSLTLHPSARVSGQSTKPEIGVCYGFNGDNLSSPRDVVDLYKKYGIKRMRIFEPNAELMEALRSSGISLTLGVRNQDIPSLASGEDAAQAWFKENVGPYAHDVDIEFIGVGNEVVPGEFSDSILPAMRNLQQVLTNNCLGTKATTVVHSAVLSTSFPPSSSQFSDPAIPFMTGILQFLSSQNSPLLVNLYPYFVYASDPANISLDYAQFSASRVVVQDGDLGYSNLLDAMLDSFYFAMEKHGVSNVNIVVSETGWPHDGNAGLTTPELAATYNRNFVGHLGSGTPKKPSVAVEGFIFAVFDEDEKAPGVERYWGIFRPNMEPNYKLFG